MEKNHIKEWWERGSESELKFRVWKDNRFQCDIDLKLVDGRTDCIMQQYIGCRDINGREIYEGDILKTDEAGWIGVVVFGNGWFMIEDGRGGFSSMPNWSGCEVIGNILENPEVME